MLIDLPTYSYNLEPNIRKISKLPAWHNSINYGGEGFYESSFKWIGGPQVDADPVQLMDCGITKKVKIKLLEGCLEREITFYEDNISINDSADIGAFEVNFLTGTSVVSAGNSLIFECGTEMKFTDLDSNKGLCVNVEDLVAGQSYGKLGSYKRCYVAAGISQNVETRIVFL